MAEMHEAKQSALEWIDKNRQWLSDFDIEIWNYHEPAWREYRSARAYCDLLRSHGFEVEESSGDMPTAFMATWENGDGPVLGSYAEYDAVPGNSQQAVPYEAPREGVHRWAAGHTDPHSMLGVATLAGILGTKAAMEKHGLQGKLKYFGEPAEKMCGSKPVHAAKGYFDDLDAAIAYHPRPYSNTTVWDIHCGAYWSIIVQFECLEPEKWVDRSLFPDIGTSHAVARAPGAIDALTTMYSLTKTTKEAMFPHTGTWTLNEFILVAGDATSDNLPPRLSQIQYSWRSPSLAIQEQIYRVLENNARAAAQGTGCVASIRWVAKTRVGLPNRAIADHAYQNMKLIGPPKYEESAREFGREIQKNLGLKPMENPIPSAAEELISPQEYEERLRVAMPDWQTNFTSDDYVDYTWHAPTVRIYTARPRLQSPSADYAYPAWAENAMGGRPELMDPGMFLAGKASAATLVDYLVHPELLEQAQVEFRERTGGGIGGDKWVAPLLPTDFAPPVDLRWPEYVETVRGSEWWVPNERSDGFQRL
jgi:aminobenzoyl-glutamate utilization protein B